MGEEVLWLVIVIEGGRCKSSDQKKPRPEGADLESGGWCGRRGKGENIL